MDASAAAAESDRMLQVQHFVIHDVLHRITRDLRLIEDAADHDGVVSGVVMRQAVPRSQATPGHLRSGHQSKEEALVYRLENFLQVVERSLRRTDSLPAADLTHKMRFCGNVVT